ncbi:MAG: AAA family ATPase [Gammaproteobacteria bacterium]
MSTEKINDALLSANYDNLDELNIDEHKMVFKKGSEIEIKPISWLWNGVIAKGKITMIAGNPGVGKSQLTANLAAIVTSGKTWPNSNFKCEPSAVVILNAEDQAEDTIAPRLIAAEADLKNIYIVEAVLDPNSLERHFNLANDLEQLDKFLIKLKNVSMIIIDPITAYLGKTDSYKNAEIRALLSPLAKIAEKHNVAIVCISHLTKDVNKNALLRIAGSLAFVAAARAAFVVIQDENDSVKRLFLPIKNNIGNDKVGFSFIIEPVQINDQIEVTAIKWTDEVVTKTADEVMGSDEAKYKSSLEEAKDFLIDLLSEQEVAANDIYKAAEDAGFSKITIRRAKKCLPIVNYKKKGKNNTWIWKLNNSAEMTKPKQTDDHHDHIEHLEQGTHDDHGNQEDQIDVGNS